MFYLVLVCVQLLVIHFCTSDTIGRICKQDDSKIVLLDAYPAGEHGRDGKWLPSNNVLWLMNEELMAKCGHIYNFHRENAREESGVMSMIIARGDPREYCNVINLNVNDYYNFDLNYIVNKELAYAGDLNIKSTHSPDICSVNNTYPDIVPCNFNNVKMVTDSVTEIGGGHLYNFITKMNFKDGKAVTQESCDGYFDNSEINIVLICLDKNVDMFKKINLDQEFCPLRFIFGSDCKKQIEKYKNKLLAVVTSTPFQIDYELYVPTIFYDVPFMYDIDDTMFPNSVLSGWQILKYVMINFLKEMNWRKVAIITDDSPYSVEFEEELTQLFREHVIMYNVQRCEDGTNCDTFFKHVLESVKNEGARLVIANFHKKYINYFNIRGLKWILRDCSYSGKLPSNLGNRYIMTLAPAGHDSTQYERLGLQFTNDVHTKIIENIKHIYNAYHHITSPNNMTRNEFYRELSRQINEAHTPMDYVSRILDEQSIQLSYMNVNRHGANVVTFKQPHRFNDVTNCAFRSNDYFRPCNDIELVLIMLVVIVFATTLLLVILYFEKSLPVRAPTYVPLSLLFI